MSEHRRFSLEEGAMSGQLWALVLAGGEGRRVRHLTTDVDGRSVPKQYASLNGDITLLRRALERAERTVPRERVAVVVAWQHRDLWSRELQGWPPGNVLVQPQNRGTGVGLLLGLLAMMQRDPGCRLLVFPADHHVDDEEALQESVERAVHHAGQEGAQPTLLGVPPERAEAGLGWIVAGEPLGPHARRVARFVEKPATAVARRLASRGALVNSMIMAADGDALLSLFQEAAPGIIAVLRHGLRGDDGSIEALASVYPSLPSCDLSRDVLEEQAGRLAVVRARGCGWSDIGTPARLARFLDRHPGRARKVAATAEYAPQPPAPDPEGRGDQGGTRPPGVGSGSGAFLAKRLGGTAGRSANDAREDDGDHRGTPPGPPGRPRRGGGPGPDINLHRRAGGAP